MTLDKFLAKHENDEGEVGRFIRSAILVKEAAESMTIPELLEGHQVTLLLDCFDPYEEDPGEESE